MSLTCRSEQNVLTRNEFKLLNLNNLEIFDRGVTDIKNLSRGNFYQKINLLMLDAYSKDMSKIR